jgi:predicted TIM-barrel fold metal-dependent hydrolase
MTSTTENFGTRRGLFASPWPHSNKRPAMRMSRFEWYVRLMLAILFGK